MPLFGAERTGVYKYEKLAGERHIYAARTYTCVPLCIIYLQVFFERDMF